MDFGIFEKNKKEHAMHLQLHDYIYMKNIIFLKLHLYIEG